LLKRTFDTFTGYGFLIAGFARRLGVHKLRMELPTLNPQLLAQVIDLCLLLQTCPARMTPPAGVAFASTGAYQVPHPVEQSVTRWGHHQEREHNLWLLNPLTPELNPSAQRCLTRFFTGDFACLTVHFVNICVKTQQMQQLFIHFINYV
jgi:hypothetical protein